MNSNLGGEWSRSRSYDDDDDDRRQNRRDVDDNVATTAQPSDVIDSNDDNGREDEFSSNDGEGYSIASYMPSHNNSPRRGVNSSSHIDNSNSSLHTRTLSIRSDMTEQLAAQQIPTGLSRHRNETRLPSMRRPMSESTRRIHERKAAEGGSSSHPDLDDLSESERPGAYQVQNRANGFLPSWYRRFIPSSGVSTASQDTDEHGSMFRRTPEQPHNPDPMNTNATNAESVNQSSLYRPQDPGLAENGQVNGNASSSLHNGADAATSVDLRSEIVTDDANIPRKSAVLLSCRRVLAVATVGVVAVIAVTVGVSIALNSKQDDSEPSESTGGSSTTSTSTSTAADRRSRLIDVLSAISPPSLFINDTSSPQHQALTWLVDDDPLQVSESDRDSLFERYALACLYFATDGMAWSDQLNFLTEKPVCEWYKEVETETNTKTGDAAYGTSTSQGVFCDNGQQVSGIRINNNGLRGTVPSELTLLSQITTFRLTGNTYMAGDDNELPLLANVVQVGKMTSLTHLDLSSNKLYGSIPIVFFDLKDLQDIDLSGNNFKNIVDQGISDLVQLRSLNLAGNDLDGTINLKTLTNLERLVLDDLNDGGLVDIQSQLLPLTKLTELSLKRVDFYRPFLPDLSAMSGLEVLDLEAAKLEGSIGTSFSALTSLRYLSVKQNFLTGSIGSDSFKALTNLEFLDLSDNSFVGNIPAYFFPPTLSRLYIYDNQFSVNGSSLQTYCQSSPSVDNTPLIIELDCGRGSGLDENSPCTCCLCN